MSAGKKNEAVLVSLHELSPVMRECLAEGQEVVLTVTGNSMSPILRHGRDQVVLVQATDPAALQAGDVPLYQRRNGRFVLHRIVERDDGHSRYRWHDAEVLPSAHVGAGVQYTMLGDAQTDLEPGIRPEQIVAVAKAFYIKGKLWECASRRYQRRLKRWHRLLPMRPLLVWLGHLPYRIPHIPARLRREIKKLFAR